MFKDPVNYNITLTNPPKYFKYSPADNKVCGTISIEFNESVKNILGITYSLVGSTKIGYYSTDRIKNRASQVSTTPCKTLIMQDFPFYIKTKKINLDELLQFQFNPKTKTYSYYKNQKLKTNFEFEFPRDEFLPSSCVKLGNKNKGEFSIFYNIKVQILQKKNNFMASEKVLSKCKIPLIYQSRLDSQIYRNDGQISITKSLVFEKKEPFYHYEYDCQELYPVSRKPKSEFDTKVSPHYVSFHTKPIPLSIKFDIISQIDISKPLIDQFQIFLISDLKTVKMYSNSSTEFQFECKSTQLGLFKIDSLQLEVKNKISLQCDDLIVKDSVYTPILNIPFKDFYFDIKDFEHDKVEDVFKMPVTKEMILEHSVNSLDYPLLELMNSRTLMTTGFTKSWFGNVVSLSFIWNIKDANNEKNSLEYYLDTAATFDFPLTSSAAESNPVIVSEKASTRKSSMATSNVTISDSITTSVKTSSNTLTLQQVQDINPLVNQLTNLLNSTNLNSKLGISEKSFDKAQIEDIKMKILDKMDDLFNTVNSTNSSQEMASNIQNIVGEIKIPNISNNAPQSFDFKQEDVTEMDEANMPPPPSYEESETQYLESLQKH